jgi:hypothetical protein
MGGLFLKNCGILFEMPVFFRLGNKIHISQRVRHLMQSHVTVTGQAHHAFQEIIPRQIDARVVNMALEGAE